MTVSTFLMFDCKAEEAMNFYVSLFADGKITRMNRYGPDQAGAEGSIMQAGFTLNGQNFLCTDANTRHAFTFTPAMSIFVDCEDEAEIDRLVAALSDGGKFLMPLDDYGFSRKFAWVEDRFKVSWQLNLL
ncbi:MAG: VOC family protein [Rhizomicrobium sp.]|jgi:predicted 3-demethylubiquinone-9 3-methyltransferase (glyoxalase superfamily)